MPGGHRAPVWGGHRGLVMGRNVELGLGRSEARAMHGVEGPGVLEMDGRQDGGQLGDGLGLGELLRGGERLGALPGGGAWGPRTLVLVLAHRGRGLLPEIHGLIL